MDHIDALAQVFEPEEEVTITFNDEVVFSGPFDEARVMLETLEIRDGDELIVSNEDQGPPLGLPNYFSMN